MTKINEVIILDAATRMYANIGNQNFSIRNLAKEIGITHSVIYHYFKNDSALLSKMFTYASNQLGLRRAELFQPDTAKEMLKQRIRFQIENIEYIVAVLKYYIMHRDTFKRNGTGYLPDKSALHIEEVLRFGLDTGEFKNIDIEEDAKVITHAINGFLLEFYPQKPTKEDTDYLIRVIYKFVIRALKGGEKE